jgi:hypothetical protein
MGTSLYDLYQKSQHPKGQIEPGNIDLTNRPRVKNPDGSTSTVRSMSFGDNGREILVPTVMDDGRVVSNDEAIANYRKTGQHLGIFSDPASATAYAQQLHQQQAKALSDTPSLYDQYQQEQQAAPQIRHDPKLRARQAARGKISDQEQADAAAVEAQPGLLGSLADVAQGVPGVGVLEAGVRSVARQQPYADAYRDITTQTDKVPTSAKLIGRTAASIPLIMALPGSAVTSGALIGGADQALDANPEKGIGARALTGALGAGVGAAFGKAGEMVALLPRVIRAPTSGANIIARQAARGAEAKAGYAAALAEGQGRTQTPAIAGQLALPDNAAIMDAQRELRQNAGKSAYDPEMLDALYKAHSTRAANLQRGVESATPSRNLGAASLKDTHLAQQDLLDAMSGGASAPGPMPSYRPAVENYAKASGDITALETGQDALRHALTKGVTTGKNIDATTKEAFTRWAQQAAPSQTQAASEGVLGATKEDLLKHLAKNLLGGRAMGKAPAYLRAVGDGGQTASDFLTKLGLLAVRPSNAPQ